MAHATRTRPRRPPGRSGRTVDPHPAPGRRRGRPSSIDGKRYAAGPAARGGVFAAVLDGDADRLPARGQLRRADTVIVDDPYRWLPTLGELDLHLIGEGRHEQLWDVLGAHVRTLRHPERPGHRHLVRGVGAERPRRPGDRRLRLLGRHAPTRCARSAPPASGSCSSPASATAPATSTRSSAPTASGGTRPTRWPSPPRCRRPPPRSFHLRLRVAATPTGWTQRAADRLARRADVDLRGAPRLVAAGPVATAQLAERAGRLRERDRLHPRRVPAGGRAPVRRLLGLPGHLLLRADLALRHPGRLPLPGRRAAPGRHRRDRRLGARALPQGRVGAGPLRRHRRCTSTPTRAAASSRTGARYVFDFGRTRGAQLPRRQRPVLARGVPRRRAAGRRGRLDALPGLLPQGRRVGAEHVRRPGEPRGGRLPAGDERDRLQAGARRDHHRRGVDVLAGRHPADPPGRSGLRLQVEHGLDARHAGLHRSTSRSTGSTTTTR